MYERAQFLAPNNRGTGFENQPADRDRNVPKCGEGNIYLAKLIIYTNLRMSITVPSSQNPRQPTRRGEPPLATRLRMALLLTSRRLRVESAGRLAEGHLSVLSILFAHGPMSAGELAEHEHVRPPSMTRTLKQLEADGYIVRSADPADRRSILAELSEAGSDYIRETRRRRDQWLQRRLASLSRDERQILSDAEKILRKVVNQ